MPRDDDSVMQHDHFASATVLAGLRFGQENALAVAAIARIRALDETFNAFLTVPDPRQIAPERVPQGPLCGIPIAIKDLTDTAGLRTTYGSALYRDNVPAEDELVVARLRRAGALIVGKTMTPAVGFGPIFPDGF